MFFCILVYGLGFEACIRAYTSACVWILKVCVRIQLAPTDARPQTAQKTTIVEPSLDHLPWRHSHTHGARWRPLFDWLVCLVGFMQCFKCSLSLSWWRKVCLPLELWQESWPNFRGLPKVSKVATNHWVFLRCEWSPVSS